MDVGTSILPGSGTQRPPRHSTQRASQRLQQQPSPEQTAKHWRDMLASERDAAQLYDGLAVREDGERAAIFRELAEVERRHAAHWEAVLRAAGEPVPSPSGPGLRTRVITTLARRLSVGAVLPVLERAERAGAGGYEGDPDAGPGMADDERHHARVLAALRGGQDDPRGRISRAEPWHRGDRSGALRAGIFGVSDGLVSNTALVMGFAGSGATRSAVLLAGVAGLLAGAFSMAAGEYVSMSGQKEMFEREIALEAAELVEKPEEEYEELVLLYRAKGLPASTAREVARHLMADRAVALDTLVREELGLDPGELGSPWRAAVCSLVTFALGALVVVIPYLFADGTAALIGAVALALSAMAAVGGGLSLLNGRPALRGALRQVATGVLAACVTFAAGAFLGVHLT